jgi:DNA-binding NarL/FixJ family response regulator
MIIGDHADRKLRVLLADDDASVRNDLRRLLELEPDIEVVAVCHDGQHAVDQCAYLLPDVAVLDIRMPVLDGISATIKIRNRSSELSVLILTTFDIDEYVLGAIRAGAAGFLLKDQAPEQLAEAVRTVARGEAILAPRATARLIEEFTKPRQKPAERNATIDSLTSREVDVLALIAQGLANETIANALQVSVPTVKTHVSNLLAKLQLQNRVQAVIWAYENDLTNYVR